jgi:membrane peptidoglycan carboxypeptidase
VTSGTPQGPYYPNPYNPPPSPPQPPGSGRRRASMYGGRPPAGGSPTRRGPRGWIRRYGPYIALALVVLISGVLGYVLFTLRDVPDPGKTPTLSRSVTVYDRKGRVIETQNQNGQFYVNLHLARMGDLNKQATMAAEDRDFYQHPAIDFTRTAAAAASDVLHRGNLQGGSTITQQLVKISVLTPQRSIFRKMQEATLAFGLESQYSKDQILEMYLNRVYYGHNAYGIGAATRVYFGSGKQPTDLTAGQAAFLAGLINGPSYYDPQVNYDGAKQRQLYVLDGMVKKGWLTQTQADQAAQEDIKAQLKYDVSSFKSLAPHFVRYVLGVVESQLQGAAQQGNLNVYTTLDLDLQNLAQRSVNAGVANAGMKREGVNNADLMAVKPDTGEILAYVGSADFNNNDIAGAVDVISQAKRQPGSTFKPYVYEAALKDHKITLASTLHDQPTNFGNGPYWPKDWDYPKTPMGNITPRTSLVQSRNITAVETAQMEGIDNVIKQAKSQGITSQLQPNLNTAIGGSEITMFEQMQGYQVFANQGTLMPLMGVTKVTDEQNNVLYDQNPGSQPNVSHPISPAEAYLVTDVLKDYNKVWGLGWKRQMSGKSGTTGANDEYHRDAWMMAYSPDIVIGGWAGNTSPNTVNGGAGYCPTSQPHCATPGAVSAFGTETGKYILGPFINGLPGSMNNWYKRPDGIVVGSGCSDSGSEIFLAGTQGGASCPSPSPTPTPSATPTPTATPSRSPTPTIRPTITPTPTGTPTPAPSASPHVAALPDLIPTPTP